MSYTVIIKFNSMQNATNFANNPNYQYLQPSAVSVNGSPDTYVIIYPSTLDLIPRGYTSTDSIQYVYDNTTKSLVYTSPTLNPFTLNVTEGDNTIISNGFPISDPPISILPPPSSLPFEFQPLYHDNDLIKRLERMNIQMDPNVDPRLVTDPGPIEQWPLDPIPMPQPYVNPYDITDPRNFQRIFPEIAPDPDAPIYMNPEFDPYLDPRLTVPYPFDQMPDPMERQDLPQRHLDPKNPTLEPAPTPVPISDTGDGGGGTSGISGPIFNVFDPNGIIYWSQDGFNWVQATIPSANFTNLSTVSAGATYSNGVFGLRQRYDYAAGLHTDFGLASYNGLNWIIAQLPAVAGNLSFTLDTANNRVGFIVTGNTTTYVYCGYPNTTPLLADFSISHAKTDPSQPAAGSFGYLSNSLPSGLTAIRFNIVANTFEVTKTPITSAIASSGNGADLAAATWVATLVTSGFNTGALFGAATPFHSTVTAVTA